MFYRLHFCVFFNNTTVSIKLEQKTLNKRNQDKHNDYNHYDSYHRNIDLI